MPTQFIEKVLEADNVAEIIDEKRLRAIASRVIKTYSEDKASRAKWDDNTKKALQLANMESENKTFPFKNASNIKHPMISRAVIQFSSNAMSELVRNGKLSSMLIKGADPDGQKWARAERVENYINYKLIEETSRYESILDKSLHHLATIGTIFRKTFFDPIKQETVTELCLYNEIAVNNNVSCLEDARRISHMQKIHSNTIIEWIRAGLYLKLDDEELGISADGIGEDDLSVSMHEVIEQHTLLDLDKDGYEEPYIVVVHKESQKVLRIIPRFDIEDVRYGDNNKILSIIPTNYFVDFHFIPAFDGGFWSIGYGQLLLQMNKTINTGLNQLIDAGTWANTQSGFITGDINLKSSDMTMSPNKFIKINTFDGDIRRAIQPFNFKEPSNVLFQLMGSLDQFAKELSSTTDIMTGNQLAQNAPATTTLTLVERGMKIYNSIQKRLFRALNKELTLYYKLMGKYLDENDYILTLDDPLASRLDFEDKSLDIRPVADPQISSNSERLAQSELLMQTLQFPEVNKLEILKRVYEAAGIKEIQNLLVDPSQMPPPPEQLESQADAQKEQNKVQANMMKQQLRQQEFEAKQQNNYTSQLLKAKELEIKEREAEIKELQARIQASLGGAKISAELMKEEIKASGEVSNNGVERT